MLQESMNLIRIEAGISVTWFSSDESKKRYLTYSKPIRGGKK